MDLIKMVENQQVKTEVPEFNIGDTVKVHVKIKEGNRERIQVFEGIVIKRQHGGINESFTVRRISYGVGVERTFLLHSPKIENIEVVRQGRVRRARLFYLRDRIGKAAKVKGRKK
jgi:large subunit ribosomal protein L19